MNTLILTRPYRFCGPRELDRRVRDRLSLAAEGSLGNVMIHLDFNARLVTALREEKLWTARTEPWE